MKDLPGGGPQGTLLGLLLFLVYINICIKYAMKAEKHSEHKNGFKPKLKVNTRQKVDKYMKPIARTERLRNSPICLLTSLLNKHHKK